LPYCDMLSDEKIEHTWEMGILENEYLLVEVLPEVGGKIKRGFDKLHGYDFIYHNTVIKPALIGLAGPWISGGIEFNWPQHHRPTTFMPLEYKVEEHANGEKTLWVGETEPLNRMKGMAGITLEPGRSYIKVKARIYNRTPFPQLFMWWANLAAPCNNDYRIVFPQDVEYVTDHDRRAVIGWPIAKGVYSTARPYDYGAGTDLTDYSAIKVQSSFMVPLGQSKMDFVSGYDEGKKLGIVTVADHNISPGKKLFHWGIGDFGDMWSSNLTDEDGPYVELMTGVYTDNQPDFAWIMPYETKCFEQYWYPVFDIGMIKNATKDAALNIEEKDGELFLGINATGDFDQCQIVVKTKCGILFSDSEDLSPKEAYIRNITIPKEGYDSESLSAEVRDRNGKVLVSYKTVKRGEKDPVLPRLPARKPEEIETIDELYVNGLHLEQYKHHTFDATEYYLEALKRDDKDMRCNAAMGNIMLNRGRFEEAIKYYDKSIERLTSRNENPNNVEVFYKKGIALRYLNKLDEAYEWLYRSIWHYSYRSAGYYALAEIDSLRGNNEAAFDKLELSLETNAKNLKALTLKAAILRRDGKYKESLKLAYAVQEEDRLDLWSKFEIYFALDALGKKTEALEISNEISSWCKDKPEYSIDIAIEYINSGFYREAAHSLSYAGEYPLALYYTGWCCQLMGEPVKSREYYERADKAPADYCFPARLEDIAVLSDACEEYANGGMAFYYLGCLYYDRFRYDDAIENWEKASQLCPEFSLIWRNLAIAYYDKKGSLFNAKLCMERALSLDSANPRLLYELQQLLKNYGASVDERLTYYEKYKEIADIRDDCYLDRITLTVMKDEYEKAIQMANKRTFHIYEGGEGKLTRLHGWMHILQGNRLLQAGDINGAISQYKSALIMPKSYGEARSYFSQESHIHYYLGVAYEMAGQKEEARRSFMEASLDKSGISEVSLYRALALIKLNKGNAAQYILKEMIEEGNRILADIDTYSYFGVGSTTPMPFEYDIRKINTVKGLLLKGFALYGLGQFKKSEAAMDEVEALEPTNFLLFIYKRLLS
jgi:tetratricopeptide (TPR) repeat protein